MSSGYVLDFSDRTFRQFFDTNLSINIDDPKYRVNNSNSKAKRLRNLWRLESAEVVARSILALVEYIELNQKSTCTPEDKERLERARAIAEAILRTPHRSCLKKGWEETLGGYNLLELNRLKLGLGNLWPILTLRDAGRHFTPSMLLDSVTQLGDFLARDVMAEKMGASGSKLSVLSQLPELQQLMRATHDSIDSFEANWREKAECWLRSVAEQASLDEGLEAVVFFHSRGQSDAYEREAIRRNWIQAIMDGVSQQPLNERAAAGQLSLRQAAQATMDLGFPRAFYVAPDFQETLLDFTFLRTAFSLGFEEFEAWWERVYSDVRDAAIDGPHDHFFCLRCDKIIRNLDPDYLAQITASLKSRVRSFEFPTSSVDINYRERLNILFCGTYAFCKFRLVPTVENDEMLEKCIDALLQHQMVDGSWCRQSDETFGDLFSTCIALHVLSLVRPVGWKDAALRGCDWVVPQQEASGFWSVNGSLPATSTVLALDAVDLAKNDQKVTFQIEDVPSNGGTGFQSERANIQRRRSLTKKFTWLHITDLHWGQEEHLWPRIREIWLEDLAHLRESVGDIDVVLFTGDLVFKGVPEFFDRMESKVLAELWDWFALKQETLPPLISIPGNHDLLWLDKLDPPVSAQQIDALLDFHEGDAIDWEFWATPDHPLRVAVNRAFDAFVNWEARSSIPRPKSIQGLLPGEKSCYLEKDGLKFGFVGLNSSFLQVVSSDRAGAKHHGGHLGRMHVDVRQLHAACGGDAPRWRKSVDFAFLLTHHPIEWLHPSSIEHFREEIYVPEWFDAQLFGHLHDNVATSLAESGSDERRFLQGTSLFGLEKTPLGLDRRHGYTIGQLEIGDATTTTRLWPRAATKLHAGVRTIVGDTRFRLESDQGTRPQHLRTEM